MDDPPPIRGACKGDYLTLLVSVGCSHHAPVVAEAPDLVDETRHNKNEGLSDPSNIRLHFPYPSIRIFIKNNMSFLQ